MAEIGAITGYAPQKAARRAYEQDDEAVRQCLAQTYPEIQARAKREKCEICWGDETGVCSDAGKGARGIVWVMSGGAVAFWSSVLSD